jgi:hypothetical protein
MFLPLALPVFREEHVITEGCAEGEIVEIDAAEAGGLNASYGNTGLCQKHTVTSGSSSELLLHP